MARSTSELSHLGPSAGGPCLRRRKGVGTQGGKGTTPGVRRRGSVAWAISCSWKRWPTRQGRWHSRHPCYLTRIRPPPSSGQLNVGIPWLPWALLPGSWFSPWPWKRWRGTRRSLESGPSPNPSNPAFSPGSTGLSGTRGPSTFGATAWTRAPEGFGPDSLAGEGLRLSGPEPTAFLTQAGMGTLLPFSETGSSSAPLHLLVAPSLPSAPALPWGTNRVFFFAGAVLGLLTLMRRNGGKESWAKVSLLLAYGAPMSVMWIGIATGGFGIKNRDTEFRKGEMVRVLAVLQEGDEDLPPEVLARAIDFDVTRLSGDTARTTIKNECHLRRTVGLPLPTSSLPSTGTMDTDPIPTIFASALSTAAHRTILTGPKNRRDLRRSQLILAGLGGMASLLGLIFLVGGRTKEKSGAG